jgi:hypothetical protein
MNLFAHRKLIRKFGLVLGLVLAHCLAFLAQQPRATPSSKNIFEDDRIKVKIPERWSVHPATETVTGDRIYEQPIGAVLAKGPFRLYLLTHHGQASGIVGGRFAEIVQYVSPWIDMNDSPWPSCPSEIQVVETAVNDKLFRRDLYFDTTHASKKALAECGNPASKQVLWYGSYFIEPCPTKDCGGGFFLSHQFQSGKPWPDGSGISEDEMTYALTYDTKTPNALPTKSDPELRAALKEVNAIVSSIVYK